MFACGMGMFGNGQQFRMQAKLAALFCHFDACFGALQRGARAGKVGFGAGTAKALFGAAHAYQNPLGMAITGTLGLLMGVIVLASGRNLWPVIIGHGLYDASRFVLFYFQGPPTG